ncbi:reverse transcriptase domain-containing protein [Tanacetum coccineum]|uniref:Reverse transcriptase domain-containing protein n=1 Tax=Tanacetum coccineum TaxID=301880 RepID=A0ABQ5G7N9_9ASTR
MDDPNITMEEYIRLEEEKARRHGKVYNWETATYGKIWDNEDVHDLGSVETKFPAIVFNDTLTSEAALLCEPTVSSLNNDEIDFRISFDESDDEDCTDLVKEISTNIGGEFTNLEILKCWSLETSRRPIRRIHQGRYGVSVPALTKDHKRNEDQYAVSRGLNTPYSRYGINIIFWKISNVVPTLRNPQYAVSNTWICRDLDNSTNNVLIPMDSWKSGLLVYRLPLSGEEDGMKGPMIIEAEMGGHFVYRMYVDGGSSSKILYEHCFNRFLLEVGSQMVPATTPLVRFSGEIIWPLGQISLLVKISDEEHSTSAWMNFMVVRSSSPYNRIIGRPRVRRIHAFPSTAHRMLKFLLIDGTKPTDMTRVPHYIAKHRLNIREGCLPVKQKKRGQAPERNKAIHEEVEKLVNADKAFQKQIGQNLEVYVDDLVIKSCTEQEIIRDIEETFKTLREINMDLNPKKCTFGAREGTFLGYKVNADGLKVCPDKVEAVLSLPSLKCLKDVQRLNGKLASLNRFLSKSAEKSFPFFKTLKKCTKNQLLIDYGGENDIRTNENFNSRITHASRTKRKRGTNHLSGGRKGSHQCSPNDRKEQETSTHLLCELCITRSRNKLHTNGKADTSSADFIVERLEDDSPDTSMEDKEELPDPWVLFTDESSCIDGSRAGLILTNPKGAKFTYALTFRFDATNNEAEHEALIVGLRIAEQMAKEPGMIKYLEKVRALTSTFKEFSIKQVPRGDNKKADALSKMASTSFAHLSKQVLVEELKEKSIDEKEVLAVVEEEGHTWMTPIHEYLTEEILLEERRKERAIRRKAGDIISDNGKQFRDNPFKDWCEKLCIRQCFAFAKHLQANGLVERANRSLGEGIKARLVERRKNWMEEISHVLWAHRTMIKSSNEETPFSLTYGTETKKEESKQQSRKQKSKAKIEKYYNVKVRNISFKPGDLVYQNNEASHAEDGVKLRPKWEGPYEVTEALGKGAYKLRDRNGDILPRTWNVCNLKKCYVHEM